MQYILTGFTHNSGFRTFAFEGIADDRVRTAYSVNADVTLARKHGIRVQELPLLCRAVLERRSEDDDGRAFTFTEGDMALHLSLVRDAIESQTKKAPSRRFGPAKPELVSPVQAAPEFFEPV